MLIEQYLMLMGQAMERWKEKEGRRKDRYMLLAHARWL